MKLVYKFVKHVIVTFQNSEADCVQPFLKPVDPEADGASDYYKVIRYPMDLTTMLQRLKDGKYREVSDIKRSLDRMFQNCFKYNSPGSDVHEKGVEF
jgi:bromodomain-containing factor 1